MYDAQLRITAFMLVNSFATRGVKPIGRTRMYMPCKNIRKHVTDSVRLLYHSGIQVKQHISCAYVSADTETSNRRYIKTRESK